MPENSANSAVSCAFPLEVAERIAFQLVERLAKHCMLTGAEPGAPPCIAVAGSIRRRRPAVHDIDLVAIPVLHKATSGAGGAFLFPEEAKPVAPNASRLAVEFCSLPGKVLQRGPKTFSLQLRLDAFCTAGFQPARGEEGRQDAGATKNILDPLPAPQFTAGIRVDLYLATPDTWATTLLIRTGSVAHNIWLCSRARELGGMLHASGDGLELPGEYDPVAQRNGPPRTFIPRTEAEIFEAISGQPSAISPDLRECDPTGHPVWLHPNGRTILRRPA